MNLWRALQMLLAVCILSFAGPAVSPGNAVGSQAPAAAVNMPLKQVVNSCAVSAKSKMGSLLNYSTPAPACAAGNGTQVADCYCRTFKKVCVGWVKNICERWLDECADRYCDPE